ncbi:hypothetical protein POSPLADRAFT_1145115 [Postia placenta MAD-698-R-SB12]|uniref:Aminoglycoside phosphotransferase domain-containing protein n=1 Tax=Postia placenta MAD-698-R-SB12 TaxID=670580 RepID=A0A1X6MYU7_9APHY|nr:hypothetical protein POSPLADRAFT_1145115 [Postia placenta MAD-698-R-SB12]OSX61548.1 hypothetical protein POSPLADRAFT_1145115 [Postia placenta MAD-698-R-SB12]
MPLPFGLYLKKTTRQEALATEYVRQHTTIPVPKVLDVVPFHDRFYVLMTKAPGEQLEKRAGHISSLSPRQLQVLQDTLRDWFDQLRALVPPDPHAVCGFGGNGVRSFRISYDRYVGPFASEMEFNKRLLQYNEATHTELAAASHSKSHRIYFTHGDINPTNILIDEDMRPVALVDWECASWMPEYWEYTTALYFMYPNYTEWCDLFTGIFPDYRVELEVEYEIAKVANLW